MRAAVCICAVLGIAVTAPAATTLNVTSINFSYGLNNIWIKADGVDELAYMGGVNANTGGPTFEVFCVDLFTSIPVPSTETVDVLSPSAIANALRAAWLLENVFNLATTTPTQGAALQLAIWDIIHDGGDGFSAGRVRQGTGGHATNAAVLTFANQYLALSVGQSSTNAVIYRDVRGATFNQMLMGSGSTGAIPEPSTMSMMALAGLAGLYWRRTRLRKVPPDA